MGLHIDTGSRSLVAWCDQCPSWRELRGTRSAALTAAAQHADQVHADQELAKAIRQGATRAADRGSRETTT